MMRLLLGVALGKVFGEAWKKTYDNAAVIGKELVFEMQSTTPTQPIIRFLGGVPDDVSSSDIIISLDSGMNAVIIPLTDATLKKIGISEPDRKNIEILTTPLVLCL